jgi:mRNA-degrading endonuclease RelE of RelBE toxin-antitoxin system
MRFKLESTREFYDDLRTLDSITAKIVDRKLVMTLLNPYRNKRLKVPKRQVYRIRIGKYRLIYEIIRNRIILSRIINRKYNYTNLK